MSLSFVITTFIDNDAKLKQLLKCVQSIFDYAIFDYIYILNDSDEDYNNKHLIRFFPCDKKIKIIETNKRRTELQTFYYILNFKENSDYYFILNDNMYLYKKVPNFNNIDVKLISYSLNNYDNIDTDLIIYILNEYFIKDKDFLKYALDNVNENIISCYKCSCIITKEAIRKINNASNFANIFLLFNDNNKKLASEYIFTLLCNYYFPNNEDNYIL